MGYIPSKFKKKQGTIVENSTSIKTGKSAKMPAPASNNAGALQSSQKNMKMVVGGKRGSDYC